jgi:hypothetical protein
MNIGIPYIQLNHSRNHVVADSESLALCLGLVGPDPVFIALDQKMGIVHRDGFYNWIPIRRPFVRMIKTIINIVLA